MDCSLPGSSIHGIFQPRVLEWVAISFSRSSWPRDSSQVSCTVGRRFTVWATREVQLSCMNSLKKPQRRMGSLKDDQIAFEGSFKEEGCRNCSLKSWVLPGHQWIYPGCSETVASVLRGSWEFPQVLWAGFPLQGSLGESRLCLTTWKTSPMRRQVKEVAVSPWRNQSEEGAVWDSVRADFERGIQEHTVWNTQALPPFLST